MKEKDEYYVVDIFRNSVVSFGKVTPFGKFINLETATQEQLEYLYNMKHPFVLKKVKKDNGSKG